MKLQIAHDDGCINVQFAQKVSHTLRACMPVDRTYMRSKGDSKSHVYAIEMHFLIA
jgi:hypothetical protein